jgi:ketosteroid isomerase-like protein
LATSGVSGPPRRPERGEKGSSEAASCCTAGRSTPSCTAWFGGRQYEAPNVDPSRTGRFVSDEGGRHAMVIGRAVMLTSVTWLLFVASGVTSAAAGAADADAVLQRDEEMARAVVAGDLTRLEEIYAPDYVYIGSEGRQITRAERLDAFRTGRLRYLATQHTGTNVRLYGNTAVVQGQTHSRVLSGGREIEGDFQYVGVWVRQGGRWRIVLTQATRIAG